MKGLQKGKKIQQLNNKIHIEFHSNRGEENHKSEDSSMEKWVEGRLDITFLSI